MQARRRDTTSFPAAGEHGTMTRGTHNRVRPRPPPPAGGAPSARASPALLRALEDSVAHAAGGQTPPQCFVTMYHPHGIAAEAWAMRGADTETNF